MAQYNKSFNFKNGLQVDNDNFIVNASGLVGIGSTIPTAHLDVKGSTVVSENITVHDYLHVGAGISVVGVSTFNDYLHIGAGVSAVGVVTAQEYYGDGSYLSNIVGFATTKFILEKAKGAPAGPNYGPSADPWGSVENTGLATGGYDLRNTTDKMLAVGIGTNRGDWGYDLIIGVNPENNKYETSPMYYGGIGFNGIQGGSLKATGIITAVAGFVGPGTSLIELDAANIAHNTINNARLPVLENSKFPLLTRVGVGATTGISTGTVEAKYLSLDSTVGIATAYAFVGLHTGNVTGNVTGNADTATTLNADSSVDTTGIITARGGFVGGAVSFTSAGIGTASIFSGDLQVQNGGGIPGDDGNVDVFFSSYNNETTIAIGRSEVVANNNAVIRYNNTATGWWDKDKSNSLDIANYSQGNINFVSNPSLVSGASSEGVFSWRKGANTAPTMVFDPTLGYLSIGATDPAHPLDVTGVTTIRGNAFVSGTISANSLTLESNFVGSLNGSVYSTDGTVQFLDKGTNSLGADDPTKALLRINTAATSGVSTFVDVMATGGIGVGTNPNDTANDNHLLTLNPDISNQNQFIVNSIGQVAIKTDTFYADVGLANPETASYFRMIGVGGTPGSAVDFSNAGNSPVQFHETELRKTRYMIPPTVTQAERNALRDINNGNSETLPNGSLVFNSTYNQLQMYIAGGGTGNQRWVGIATVDQGS